MRIAGGGTFGESVTILATVVAGFANAGETGILHVSVGHFDRFADDAQLEGIFLVVRVVASRAAD